MIDLAQEVMDMLNRMADPQDPGPTVGETFALCGRVRALERAWANRCSATDPQGWRCLLPVGHVRGTDGREGHLAQNSTSDRREW